MFEKQTAARVYRYLPKQPQGSTCTGRQPDPGDSQSSKIWYFSSIGGKIDSGLRSLFSSRAPSLLREAHIVYCVSLQLFYGRHDARKPAAEKTIQETKLPQKAADDAEHSNIHAFRYDEYGVRSGNNRRITDWA